VGLERMHPENPPRLVVYIGDGAVGGGMSFEGMNHAGHLKKNMLVVLNDNRMSISPTVGAMAAYLNRLRNQQNYQNLRNDAFNLIKKLPKYGGKLEDMANTVLDIMKHSVNPGQIFTELGFDYQGPVDGHDLGQLVKTLKWIKNRKGPVLLHILTQKGRGYKPKGRNSKATIGPHSLGPLPAAAVTESEALAPPAAPAPSYSEAFSRALLKLGAENPHLIGLTAAMPEGTGLDRFAEKYPDRYFDVGICEQHAAGFSAGLAAAGLRPVFAVYSTFLQRAFDQIYHDIIMQAALPVLFCIDRAGLVGDDGPSHQGVFDLAFLRLFPDIILLAPKDGQELEQMLAFCLAQPKTSAIRYPREAAPPPDFFTKHEPLALGQPEVLSRGSEVCLLALGAMVARAVAAAERLGAAGLKASVVNARFAKPLAAPALLEFCRRHRLVVTLEDGISRGGFGSAVLEEVLRAGGDTRKIRCLGVPDRLIEHGPREEQLKECGLDAESIVRQVKQWMAD